MQQKFLCCTATGAIFARKRKDGAMGHTAVTGLKKNNKVVHTESKDSGHMERLISFAVFLTRRQEEITRTTGKDLHRGRLEITVRGMKNPG